MPLYTNWTRADFRNVVRRELMDTNTRWTQDTELNLYLDLWLQDIQQEFELVWGLTTLTAGTATGSLVINTNTMTPGMLRCEAVYWKGYRLAGRNLQDIEVGNPIWRSADPDTPRLVASYPDAGHVLVWPTPPAGSAGAEMVFEYPVTLAFATDTSTSGLPVWTQWSAKPFVCSRVYQRPGPINDPKRAQRYAAQYAKAKQRVRSIWSSYLPERYRVLKPGPGQYEGDIFCPPPAWDCGTNTATGTA